MHSADRCLHILFSEECCAHHCHSQPVFCQHLQVIFTDSAVCLDLSVISDIPNLADLPDNALADAMPKYKSMIDSLQSALNIVNRNRSELDPQAVEAPAPRQPSSSVTIADDEQDDETYEDADDETYEDADDEDDEDYDDYDDGDDEE